MSLQVRIVKDELTPAAAKLKGGLTKLRPILEVVGLEVERWSLERVVEMTAEYQRRKEDAEFDKALTTAGI